MTIKVLLLWENISMGTMQFKHFASTARYGHNYFHTTGFVSSNIYKRWNIYLTMNVNILIYQELETGVSLGEEANEVR